MGFNFTLEQQPENRAHCNGEIYVGIVVRYIRTCVTYA